MITVIDFGTSNTDVLLCHHPPLQFWSRPYRGKPSPRYVKKLLKEANVSFPDLRQLVCTGGQHRLLPDKIDHVPLRFVPEVRAVGRGGQALLMELTGEAAAETLVVSAGSGTAIIAARQGEYQHITGTAVGGGTLTGLARLLLKTTVPEEIDRLAQKGDPNKADLCLREVVSGPIGTLPPEATAVNFGKLARQKAPIQKKDLAASLVTMVGQVIALLAINAAHAQQLPQIIFTGHLIDLCSIRTVIRGVADLYQMKIWLPRHPGRATVLGALYCYQEDESSVWDRADF